MSLRRFSEQEIIDEIYNITKKTLTNSGLFRIKQLIKKDSYYWLKTMRQDQYAYIHEFKERINEILDLQKKHNEMTYLV